MTTQHYTGSCQCGAIAFQIDADLDQTFSCNCRAASGWVSC